LEVLSGRDLLVVGEGPQACELRHLSQRLGVAARVHFAGWRPDVLEILLASELMVLPSRWEGMPNVLLEAMAAGLPVVCARAAGVEEALGPLAGAQTVAVDDMELFSRRVLTIAKDPALAARLGQQNRQRVAEHFSLHGMIDQFGQLFEALARPAADS
jgi:glycosyltransferase involved in cell wall biosynthesis